MEERKTNPVVYILGTLLFIGVAIGFYILGMKNPINLSIGQTSKPTPTAYVAPTEEPLIDVEDIISTTSPTATSKSTILPIKTINPNIRLLVTPTPTAKSLQLKTLSPSLKPIGF